MKKSRAQKNIIPRNLTARAERRVTGNPANTRLESGVANCFPGLEGDVRNLDRRFFPGLLFEFVALPEEPPVKGAFPTPQGLRLLYLDYLTDPMLPIDSPEAWVQDLLVAYQGNEGQILSEGDRWYLDWVEQGGKRLMMYDPNMEPYDGYVIWRLIRALEPDIPVTINLIRRDVNSDVPKPSVQLTGYRRRYLNQAGVIDDIYRPGELSQSLCSPWTHDFRDCACHYWASNHPDVVMGEVTPGQTLPDGESTGPERAETYLDWLREDRGPSGRAAAFNSIAQNRPYQFDHYQINQRWEELNFVLEGREISHEYRRETEPLVKPYRGPEAMIKDLETNLAPMEMALAIQYLYAYFSVREPDEVPPDRWPTMKEDLIFVRRFILLVAIGEMTHLRWVNQMLWELYNAGFCPNGNYKPVVKPAKTLLYYKGEPPRPRALRPLTPETLESFINIERPEGAIERAYTKCVATLEQEIYPRHIYELAVRIDTDGNEHFNHFRYIREVLQGYQDADPSYPYLRDITVGTRKQAKAAYTLYHKIVKRLKAAYRAEANRDFAQAERKISKVRQEMDRLLAEADQLGRKGIGVPFWREKKP